MATRKLPRLNGPPFKSRKVDDQRNDAADNTVVEEPTPPIFDLIDDCCYAILDYLSFEDLQSFGQTCKWAQQIAYDFYKMNHSARVCVVKSSRDISAVDAFDLKTTQKIRIQDRNVDPYRHVKSYCDGPIKQIELKFTTLTAEKVNCLKKVLRTVEHVTLRNCKINGDFYTDFLKFCAKVKVLRIYGCSFHLNDHILIGANNEWLTQKYPTLEHFSVYCPTEINELKTFFKRNPNVRSFATTIWSLEKNLELIKTTDIKLDKLAIRINYGDKTEFCEILNSLHERGVFQRLHLHYWHELPDKEVSLNALEKLSVKFWSPEAYIDKPLLLANIKLLTLRWRTKKSTMETIARNLTNLECVYLCASTPNHIVQFVRHAVKLKKIKVDFFPITISIATKGGLDLAAWNKERAKLTGARKVAIYVSEHIYLATKWKTDKTNYSLVELKRESSYDWDEDFHLW